MNNDIEVGVNIVFIEWNFFGKLLLFVIDIEGIRFGVGDSEKLSFRFSFEVLVEVFDIGIVYKIRGLN